MAELEGKKQDLKFEDLVSIRQSITEGIVKGEAKPALSSRRAGLAEKLDCLEGQVLSVGAHLRISAEHSLKELSLDAQITRDDLIVWHYEWSRLPSRRERRNLVRELADLHDLNPKKCQALINRYQEKQDRYFRKARLKAASPKAAVRADTLQPEAPPPPEPQEESRITVVSKETKVLADFYDFAAKIAWRAIWAAFIARHLSPFERRSAKVLCLPSLYCQNEVQLYLDLGFKPEKILAVEGTSDPEERKLFVENANKLGVRYELGDLIDILPKLDESFDVVSLDFLGGLCMKYMEILNYVSLSNRALILVNTQAGRESREIQYRLFYDLVLNGWTEIDRGDERFQDEITKAVRAAIDKAFSDDRPGIKKFREETVDAGILSNVGLQCRQNPWLPAILQRLWAPEVIGPEGILAPTLATKMELLDWAWTQLAPLIGQTMTGDRGLSALENGCGLVSDVLFGRAKIKELERWRYQSAGAAARHYNSCFAVVDTRRDKYSRWSDSTKPIINSLLHYFEYMKDHIGPEPAILGQVHTGPKVTAQYKSAAGGRTDKIKINDRIIINQAGANYSVPVARLLRNIREYTNIFRNHIKVHAGSTHFPERRDVE